MPCYFVVSYEMKEISRANLKNIACLSMLCDHIGFYLLLPLIQSSEWQVLVPAVSVFRCIGRLAFPLFAFLLAEGMHYTKCRSRYLLRLAAFFLISEIPFDLVSSGHAVAFEAQNVLISLFFAGVNICLLDWIWEKTGQTGFLRWFLLLIACALCTLACVGIRGEYAMLAPVLAFVFYFCRYDQRKILLYGTITIISVTVLSAAIMPYFDGSSLLSFDSVSDACLFQMPSVLALPILCQYLGNKGKGFHPMFYYLFYPCHLLIIYLL